MIRPNSEIKSFKEFNSALEKGELLRLDYVKVYVGEFTGKMVLSI